MGLEPISPASQASALAFELQPHSGRQDSHLHPPGPKPGVPLLEPLPVANYASHAFTFSRRSKIDGIARTAGGSRTRIHRLWRPALCQSSIRRMKNEKTGYA